MKGYHKCRDWAFRENGNCNGRPCPNGRQPGTCLIKDKPKHISITKKELERALELAAIELSKECPICPLIEKECIGKCSKLVSAHFLAMAKGKGGRG